MRRIKTRRVEMRMKEKVATIEAIKQTTFKKRGKWKILMGYKYAFYIIRVYIYKYDFLVMVTGFIMCV